MYFNVYNKYVCMYVCINVSDNNNFCLENFLSELKINLNINYLNIKKNQINNEKNKFFFHLFIHFLFIFTHSHSQKKINNKEIYLNRF